MDVSDPFYCKLNSTDDYNGIGKNFSYKIVTKPSPTLIWKGFSCSQWIETKTIEGSFWLGSYDTTFSHSTKLVEPSECWSMVQTKNCGSHQMTANNKMLSFIKKPEGEGKWFSKVEHSVLNCQAHEITLSQEDVGQPIFTPFGPIQANIDDKSHIINHHTI